MKVIDINSVCHLANSIEEMKTLLQRRNENGFNSFWLSHDDVPYPKMALLVNAGLAIVHYFPKEYVAGFQSVGNLLDLEGESTRFAISKYSADDAYLPNTAVVSFSDALRSAKEFFGSEKMPQTIEWYEL
jgi:hypothetical protein